MAIKATIFKANLQIADMDRHVYRDHAVTLARHPSETDERMMVRLVVLALNLPADAEAGTLEIAKGMWDPDEPELWHRDLTGRILHWIEVGQPDERRLLKASGRADRVSVYSYSASPQLWWDPIAGRVARARNVEVWHIDPAASSALAALAERSMQLQVNIEGGSAWVTSADRTVEVSPRRLESR
ncbi:YaeQ family protein [Piscinibacter koreensis]|uniref:YaeQ family protein n=1 Tax=Piscinibacter koreensis TaxID=2742824 RepID=A0A7Y6TXI3_9BURK|nr:YaeQ family protein [Schlegelella koreensis]NUZ07174.1 YaeQ family protein [Schlegelella koreensis]